MENTSSAASVSFVALSRIARDHATTGTAAAVRGTGLSLTSPWSGFASTGMSATGSAVVPAVRRECIATEHNYIDIPAANVAAANVATLAKQGAPPRGEPR